SGTRMRWTAYSRYLPESDSWAPAQLLDLPAELDLGRSGAGCSQWVELPDGDILLPVYFGTGHLSSTVLRCRFDGEVLSVVEGGSQHTIAAGRGLYEPSLATDGERFFLTLRNDEGGHLAVSEDGLHFAEPTPWTFD